MRNKRRALVLGDETARHPFRQSLPPHVRVPIGPDGPARRIALTLADLRTFLATYCACFVGAVTFLS